MARTSLLEAFREDLRRGTHPAVARAKVRTALIERRQSPGTVARHVDRITEILDRAQAEVEAEREPSPEPAA